MSVWSKTEKVIDGVAEIMGKIGWLLVLYCMILGVTDVFLRYVLNNPSQWISVTVQFAMVLMACVGGVYAFNSDSFVKLDLFYANFSKRKKAICDIITSVLTFLFLGVLIWKGYQAAMFSIKLKQVTPTSIPLPLYPLKTFIPISGVIMLLVAIKKLVNDIRTILSPGKKTTTPR
jgi:TRAP-type mannitol/chloroaromatic compound transport system permease small subunit